MYVLHTTATASLLRAWCMYGAICTHRPLYLFLFTTVASLFCSSFIITCSQQVRFQTDPQRTGVVRYVGETQFATGVWIGVELPPTADPPGAHDARGVLFAKGYDLCVHSFLFPTHVQPIASRETGEYLSRRYLCASSFSRGSFFVLLLNAELCRRNAPR